MLFNCWWWFCPNVSSSWKVIGGRDRTHDEWFKKADLSIVPHPLLLSHPAKLGPLRAVHLLRSSKNLTRSRSDRGQTTFPGQWVCQHEMSLWMSNHGSQETNCCCWCWCWWWCWQSERPPTTSTPSSSVSQLMTEGLIFFFFFFWVNDGSCCSDETETKIEKRETSCFTFGVELRRDTNIYNRLSSLSLSLLSLSLSLSLSFNLALSRPFLKAAKKAKL